MIPDSLKENKRLLQLGTVAKVTAALRAIEADVERAGYYPQNRGQITLIELSRRAGIGKSTIKNKGHKEFAAVARAWVARMRAKVSIQTTAPVSMKTSVKIADDQVRALQQLNAFKILYDEMSGKVEKLEAENAQLRKKIITLAPHYVI